MPRESRSRSPRKRRSKSRSRSARRAEAESRSSSESSREAKKTKKKKHKNKSEKKSKKHKKNDKAQQALSFLQNVSRPENVGRPNEILTPDDYFRKATEFRVWLQRQGRYLEQYSAEKARSKFGKFVEQWNAGSLTPEFYSGMDRTAIAEKLSKHKWKFKNVTSEEAATRETTRDTVDTFTKAKGGENLSQLGPIAFRQAAEAKAHGPVGPVDHPKRSTGPALDDRMSQGPSKGPSVSGISKSAVVQAKSFPDKRLDEQNQRGNDARAKEEARMSAFKAQMAPFLNFDKK